MTTKPPISDAPKRRKSRRTHEPHFTSASVHFVMTASLSDRPDPAAFSRRLLDADVAVAAAWPTETAIRVAQKYRKQASQIRRLRRASAAFNADASTPAWAVVRFMAVSSPLVAADYARHIWRAHFIAPRLERFVAAPTVLNLVRLASAHPLFTTIRVLPNVTVSWRGTATKLEHAEALPVLDGIDDKDEADIDEMLDDVESNYLDRQVVSAAIRELDLDLFGGRDRNADGFVRVMLRESYHEIALPGTEETFHVVFEPRLMLHHSGIVQLDLSASVEADLDVDQVLSLMWGPDPRIVRSKMATPLIAGTQWAVLGTVVADEVDAGAPLRTIDHEEPVSFSEAAHVHMQAVLSTMSVQLRHWIIYPVAILGASECCEPDTWRVAHTTALRRLVYRGHRTRPFADDVVLPPDLLMGREASLFATLASSAYIQWQGKPPVGISELSTVLVVEHALLQYMRLKCLEEQVTSMAPGGRELSQQIRIAIELFSELGQRDIHAGEARDIAKYILGELGSNEMRRTIETGLELATSAHQAWSSVQSARRAWWLSFAATLVASLVAIEPIQKLILAVEQTAEPDDWMTPALSWLSARGVWASPIVILGVTVMLGAIRAIAAIRRSMPWRIPSFRRGFKWPTEFTVSTTGTSPAATEPRATRFEASTSG